MNTRTTRLLLIATALGGLGVASIASAQTPARPNVLEVRGFVGRIEVDTSVGGALRATVTPGRDGLGARISQRDRNLVVDGGFEDTYRMSCEGSGDRMRVSINGRTYRLDELPVLRVSGSPGIGVRTIRSSVAGRIGPVGGVTLAQSGCLSLVVGDVRGSAEVSAAGSGDLRIGSVGDRLEVSLAGAGDVAAGRVGGSTKINIAGSGNVVVAQPGRDLSVALAGSGDVEIAGGEARTEISIAGSGDVRFGGIAIDPSVSILGSGDVTLGATRGERAFSRLGSGSVTVER